METYQRRQLRKNPSKAKNKEMIPSLARELRVLQTDDEHFEVGSFYKIDHTNLTSLAPVQLKAIRVVMVTEKTELNVSVRYASIGSLRTYLSNNKICSIDIYPFLDEIYVMGTQLAGKVLNGQVSSEEYLENKHLEGFWLVDNSGSETTTPSMSQLIKSNGKVLNKHGDSSSQAQSSSSFVKGEVKFEQLEIDDINEEEEDVGGGSEGETDDEKNNQNLKRKRKRKSHSLTTVNSKAKKPKRESQRQVIKKSKIKSEKIGLGNAKSRWSAERYKLAEENLLEVMKAKNAVFNNPMMRPALRAEARKRIGDTGLLDHLLMHMSGKIAPGGSERFRRRYNADGQMEYWLESADLVNIRKAAGVQDPYWTPPPGWNPGDCPTQDPVCARELKLLKEDNAKLRRDMEESKKHFKEELDKLRREMNELSMKKREESLAIEVSNNAVHQKLNVDSSLMAPSKSGLMSALVQLDKDNDKEQGGDLSSYLWGKEDIGKLNSKVEDIAKSGPELIAPAAKECC